MSDDQAKMEAAAKMVCDMMMAQNHGKRCLHTMVGSGCLCGNWDRAMSWAKLIVGAYQDGRSIPPSSGQAAA